MRWLFLMLLSCSLSGVANASSPESSAPESKSLESSALDSSALDSSELESRSIAQAARTKPVLLFFRSRGCRPCQILESTLSAPKLARTLESSYDFYRIDIYGREPLSLPLSPEPISVKDLRRDLGVFATPTLVFFDTHLEPVFTHQGTLKERELMRALELVRKIPAKLDSLESKSQWVKSQLLDFIHKQQ